MTCGHMDKACSESPMQAQSLPIVLQGKVFLSQSIFYLGDKFVAEPI